MDVVISGDERTLNGPWRQLRVQQADREGTIMTAHANHHPPSAADMREVNESTFKKLLKERHLPDQLLLVHPDNGRPPQLAAMQRYWAPWYSISMVQVADVAGRLAVRVQQLEEPLLPWEDHYAFQKLVDRVLSGKRQGIRATAARIIGPAPAHKWVAESSLDPQLPVSKLNTGQWVELYQRSQDTGFGNLSGGRSIGNGHKPQQASGRQGAREPKLRW